MHGLQKPCERLCLRLGLTGGVFTLRGRVNEGRAWWEWMQCSGAGGAGADALANSLSSSKGAGVRLCGMESLELRQTAEREE